jgi:hypothetical protein
MRKERKMNGRHSVKRRPLALALVVAIGAMVLAGCGGSSGGSSAASSTTASASGSTTEGSGGPGGMQISDEARACLKEKGVELPEFKGGEGGRPPAGEGGEPPEGGGEMPEGGPPGEGGPAGAGGPGGEGFEKMQKAFEECGVETGEFKGGPGAGAPDMNSAAFRKQIKEYAACVRENGYELAEPDFSGEGPVFKKAESESAAFKKASAKCKDLLGGR